MCGVERLLALFLKVENLAYRYLDRMFQKNTLNDLDILCDFDLLQFQTASILQEVDKNYYQSVFICKLDIFQGKNKKLGYYKLILDMDYQFLDEFFVIFEIFGFFLETLKKILESSPHFYPFRGFTYYILYYFRDFFLCSLTS